MLPAHSSEPQQSSVFSQEPKRGEQVGGGGAWQTAPLQVKSTLQQGSAPTTHRAPSATQMGLGSGTAQNPPWQVRPSQQGSLTTGSTITAMRRRRMVHAPPSTTHMGGGVTIGPIEDVVLDVLEIVELVELELVELSVLLLDESEEVLEVLELIELVELELLEEDTLDEADELVWLVEAVDEEEIAEYCDEGVTIG